MIRYSLPLLLETHRALFPSILREGRISANQMFVDLTENFDWKDFEKPNGHPSPNPLPPTVEVNNQKTIRSLKEPTVKELATNFLGAMHDWISKGLPIVTQRKYDERASICDTCEFWIPNARMGMGKCNHKGCGCTKFKRWLATEQCPEKKWPLNE